MKEEQGRCSARHHTNKEELIKDVKVKGSLGCCDHKTMELRIPIGQSGAKSKTTMLNFRKADFGLFKDLLGEVSCDNDLKGRESQKAG